MIDGVSVRLKLLRLGQRLAYLCSMRLLISQMTPDDVRVLMRDHEGKLHERDQLRNLSQARRWPYLQSHESPLLLYEPVGKPQNFVEHRFRHDNKAKLGRFKCVGGSLLVLDSHQFKMKRRQNHTAGGIDSDIGELLIGPIEKPSVRLISRESLDSDSSEDVIVLPLAPPTLLIEESLECNLGRG